MGNSFGRCFRISTWGESHGGGVGCVVDGVPPKLNITQEELSSCFHLPSEAACRRLGIGLTVLKRQCRKFGIKRWPFRKMKSLDRLITNVQAGISPGDQNRTLVKSVEELEEQKQRMQECHELDLDDDTKRLQQAYSKANHKARRAAHQTDMGGVGGLLARRDRSLDGIEIANVSPLKSVGELAALGVPGEELPFPGLDVFAGRRGGQLAREALEPRGSAPRAARPRLD